MADSDGCFPALAGVIGFVIVAAIVLYIIYITVQVMAAAGALYGAGIALRNYGLAFAKHVKPERVAP